MILENDRLRVEVVEPGTAYRRMRFDWTGIVSQVVLDGKHTFCTIELPEGIEGPNTEGIGLTNDFGLADPVGWEEAEVGESFPKLAVGTLTKTVEGRYQHMRDYPLVPTQKHWYQDAEGIHFTIDPLPCRGYAVALEKHMYIQDASLFIRTTLRNVGERAIHTSEYNHNFVAIDGRPIGEGVEIDFPAEPEDTQGRFPLLSFVGKRLVFKAVSPVFWFNVPGAPHTAGERFTLRDTKAGAGLRESGDFPLHTLSVWGKEHTVCPETTVALDVDPGDAITWTRRWDFFNLD